MRIPNYNQYQPFQDVFQKLPEEHRESVERGVRRLLKSDEAIAMVHGTEELPSVSTLSSCQSEEFVDMDKIPWETTSYGRPDVFIRELEWALADVNDIFGFDDYGLPRVMYHRQEEVTGILDQLPDLLKELIVEKLGSNDPSFVEYRLRDRDGYISGDDFATWCLEVSSDVDEHLERLINELGDAITRVNTRVFYNRAASYSDNELSYFDGERPGDRIVT